MCNSPTKDKWMNRAAVQNGSLPSNQLGRIVKLIQILRIRGGCTSKNPLFVTSSSHIHIYFHSTIKRVYVFSQLFEQKYDTKEMIDIPLHKLQDLSINSLYLHGLILFA
jgi:hypothetical protein